jgi:tripartite-type tricarboxylate transporter receptor subunit TctC
MSANTGVKSNTRRTVMRTMAAAALAPWFARAASAAESGSIRIISPAPPGGTLDTAIRIITTHAAEPLGQSFIIDSRPGASGNIAGEAVARAQPDGSTLLLGYDAIHATNPHVFSRMPFNASDCTHLEVPRVIS